MRFKKKVMAFVLCGIIGVLNCLPAFAADDVAESVCAEGEEGIMPLSEACPKCGWGDFVCGRASLANGLWVLGKM